MVDPRDGQIELLAEIGRGVVEFLACRRCPEVELVARRATFESAVSVLP